MADEVGFMMNPSVKKTWGAKGVHAGCSLSQSTAEEGERAGGGGGISVRSD